MRDEVILQKIRSGDPAGLEALMERYLPYVSAVVWNILRNAMPPEDGEEVVSDVFLAAWRQPEALRPGLVKGWLAAVARNKAADWLRRCRPADPIPDNAPDPSPGPEELAQRREQSARLWAAVDALEEPDRTLFLRYYYEGDKLKTVAAELGLSQTAAKQRLFRGRKTLKAALKGVETP